VNRLERLYAISDRLRRTAPTTIPARIFAEEFGVTRRTIERDLASLKSAGVPLFGQSGRSGGAGSIAKPQRILAALSDSEVMAVILAVDLARDAPFGAAASSAAARLLETVSGSQAPSVAALRDRFRVAASTAKPVSKRVRSTIEDAVHRQTAVRLHYVDSDGVTTSRLVEPTGFYYSEGTWSLVAWCRLRDAGRLFRLHRITRAVATRQPCVERNIDEVLGWVPRPGRAP
jgi:predicted DNA-binding transcriptional regulator YafY